MSRGTDAYTRVIIIRGVAAYASLEISVCAASAKVKFSYTSHGVVYPMHTFAIHIHAHIRRCSGDRAYNQSAHEPYVIAIYAHAVRGGNCRSAKHARPSPHWRTHSSTTHSLGEHKFSWDFVSALKEASRLLRPVVATMARDGANPCRFIAHKDVDIRAVPHTCVRASMRDRE